MKRGREPAPVVAVLALCLLLTAAVAESTMAGLRVLGAEMDGDVLLVQLVDAAPFASETGGVASYALLPGGTNRIWLRRAPGGDQELATPLAPLDVDLEAGAYYTLLVTFQAVAQSSPSSDTLQAETALLRDAFDSLPPPGQASLRIAHAAPAHAGFTVAIRPHESDTPAEDGDVADRDAEDDGEGPDLLLQVEPLRSTDRIHLAGGAYDVMAHRDGEAWRGEPLRIELHSGVAYTLYLTAAAPDGAAARLVIDAAMPAPPHRERD